MERHTGTYIAKKPSGENVTLYKYQVVTQITGFNTGTTERLGVARLTAREGHHVNLTDKKGVYEILETGETVRCDDPNAP